MDIIDRAQTLEEQQRAAALAAHPAPKAVKLDLRKRFACRDCGERIQTERLRALPSAQRCLYCEHAFERRRNLAR